MQYRQFADTDIQLSQLGLGAMGMSFSYGKADNQESLKTLDLALELGINFWDTADIYGNGANERLIGESLKGRRDKVFLASKFGFVLDTPTDDYIESLVGNPVHVDGSPKYIKAAVDASLSRLNTDYIDLYYMHRPDPNTPIEESVNALADLVKEGKIRYIGVSEFSVEQLKIANQVHKISALQSEYSLLTRDVESEILPLTKELGMAFIPFSPLARGLMSNALNVESLTDSDFRKKNPRFEDEYLVNNQNIAAGISEIAKSKNMTSAQLALAWVMAQQDNIIPIPGTKRRKYLEENAKSVDVTLTRSEIHAVQALLERYPNVGPRYATSESKFIDKK